MINDYEATKTMTTDAEMVSSVELSKDEIASKLNGLIEICKDGQNGFKSAADAIESPDLTSFFNECSQHRAKFAMELQSLVAGLDGDPQDSGSFAGIVHRGWMDLKAAIEGNDPKGILNECERGEDYAKGAYKDVLKETLPANVRETVQRQYDSVLGTHDRVKTLRDSYGKDADTIDASNSNNPELRNTATGGV